MGQSAIVEVNSVSLFQADVIIVASVKWKAYCFIQFFFEISGAVCRASGISFHDSSVQISVLKYGYRHDFELHEKFWIWRGELVKAFSKVWIEFAREVYIRGLSKKETHIREHLKPQSTLKGRTLCVTLKFKAQRLTLCLQHIPIT